MEGLQSAVDFILLDLTLKTKASFTLIKFYFKASDVERISTSLET